MASLLFPLQVIHPLRLFVNNTRVMYITAIVLWKRFAGFNAWTLSIFHKISVTRLYLLICVKQDEKAENRLSLLSLYNSNESNIIILQPYRNPIFYVYLHKYMLFRQHMGKKLGL